MKYWFATLVVVAMTAATLLSLPSTIAQASPIQELGVTITDYESEKVMPGSTFKVRFTVHKPAGMKVTDGLLGVSNAYYVADGQFTSVFTPISGSSKAFSLPFLDEQDAEQELYVKILENAPVGQPIHIVVTWDIADVSVSISENENQVTIVSGENVFVAPVVKISPHQNYTYYFIVDGITSDVCVRSDKSNRLYVVGISENVEVLPEPFSVLVVAIIGVAIILILIVAIVAYKFRDKITGSP